MTMIIVTHEMNFAQKYRIVLSLWLMVFIQEEGTPEQIF